MNANALLEEIARFVDHKRETQEETTATQYQSVLESILVPWCATVKITRPDQLDDAAMLKFQKHLEAKKNRKGEPLSRASVRTYVRAIRVFLNFCKVPRGDYKQPKKPSKRVRDVLTRQEIDTIEAAGDDERDRLIVRVLGDCGLRVNELLTLKRENLHEDKNRKQYKIRVIGKGDKQREIPISGPLFVRLKHYAEHGGPKDCEFIFCAKRRDSAGKIQPLTRSGIDQLIRHLAHKAKIERRVWPHLFRHSFITHLIEKNVNLVTIQTLVGHENLTQIAEVYANLTTGAMHDTLMEALK
jgi:integrase/recombinase XerD